MRGTSDEIPFTPMSAQPPPPLGLRFLPPHACRSLVVAAAIIASLGQPCLAANWSGILSPGRAADWSSAGLPGGIPNRTTIFKTLAPGATAAEINAAIASCPGGEVVQLGAGTYTLSSRINFNGHSDVTLRGAGADQTFLIFVDGPERKGKGADETDTDVALTNFDAAQPHFEDNTGGTPSHSADWTDGYTQGATEITLSSAADVVPGKSVLCLDQLDDSDTDTGTIWVNQKKGVSGVEGPGGAGRKGRAQMQMVLATAVHGNRVTISPGLYMPNWRRSQSPGAWWANAVVSGDGIEDLSIDHLHSGSKSGILIFNATRCWVKGVRDINSNRDHVWLYLACHCVVRDSYFYGTQNKWFLSYGVETYMGADNLVENNIFQHVVSPMIANGTGAGTVFGYNYAVDDYYADDYARRTKIRVWFLAANAMHAAGTDMMLIEGNDSTGFITDYIHGTHHLITAFRNQFIGWEPGMARSTVPVNLFTHSRYMNLVGNVLGKPGYHDTYECSPPNGKKGDTSIYLLGWSGNGGHSGDVLKDDPTVAGTLMRWGNYDSVTQESHWDASEVPSNLGQLANPLPASHRLPTSFYLTQKPAWWGRMPWPAIGPEVSGGDDPTGHVFANPAEVYYRSAPRDMSYPADEVGNRILVFNAKGYYATPAAP
jgi:hypothetical protein